MSTSSMFDHRIMARPDQLWWQCGDEGPKRVCESLHYEFAKQFLEGTASDDSRYIKAGLPKSPGHIQGDGKQFADLIDSMVAFGWRGQDRVKAWINRRGELVLTDGLHRTSASLAVGLKEIPVSVVARDEDWWRLKHALKRLNGGVKLYQHIDHPDLQWPCWRKDTQSRSDRIGKLLLDVGFKNVIEIGCHSGAMSCAFARMGMHVDAYEVRDDAVRTVNLLASMTDIGAAPGTVSAYDYRDCGVKDLDGAAVVCLSVLNHHIVSGDGRGEKLFSEMASKSDTIILDCPKPGDPVGGDDARINSPKAMQLWVSSRFGGKITTLDAPGDGPNRALLMWKSK